jgi:dihydroflavonol-4-reductase
LRAAMDAGVKKVIFTSSTAAIGNEAPPDRALNENDWNQDPRLAYVYAKTEAEKRAWRFAEENALNMVVINPGAIIGPGFYHHTPSTMILERALRGNLPGIPPYSFTYVDVRDVAELHILAYENPNAKGRYIAADRYLTLAELLELIREIDGKIRIPRMRLSRATLKVFSVFDWLNHTLLGSERQVTLKSISEFANRKSWLSAERARKELGWQPMDFTESLKDTLDWIRKTFISK